jgi:hypothetical protein
MIPEDQFPCPADHAHFPFESQEDVRNPCPDMTDWTQHHRYMEQVRQTNPEKFQFLTENKGYIRSPVGGDLGPRFW